MSIPSGSGILSHCRWPGALPSKASTGWESDPAVRNKSASENAKRWRQLIPVLTDGELVRTPFFERSFFDRSLATVLITPALQPVGICGVSIKGPYRTYLSFELTERFVRIRRGDLVRG